MLSVSLIEVEVGVEVEDEVGVEVWVDVEVELSYFFGWVGWWDGVVGEVVDKAISAFN